MSVLGRRLGTGSSIATIILVAFAVITTVSVSYLAKVTYDKNSGGVKLVNELSYNYPSLDNLKSLGLVDATKVASGSEVIVTKVDDISGIKQIRITNAETGAIVPITVNGLDMDYANVEYAGGDAIVQFAPKTNSRSIFTRAAQIIQYSLSGLFDGWANGGTVTGCSGKTATASSTGAFSFLNVNENTACNDIAVTTTNWATCSIDGPVSLTGNVSASGNCIGKVLAIGGTGSDALSMFSVLDNSGNVYVAGTLRYNGTKDFLGSQLTLTGTNDDVFVAKIGNDGIQKWIKTMGGKNGDTVEGITLGNNGEVIVYGTLGLISPPVYVKLFDDSVYTSTLTKAFDGYLARLSNSDGTTISFNMVSGTNPEELRFATTDASGSIYYGGTFYSGTVDISGNSITGVLTNSLQDGYVQKVDSNLNHVWTKKIGGTQSETVFKGIVDPSGDLIVSGEYVNGSENSYGVLDFSGATLTGTSTAINDYEIFIAKLNGVDGTQKWIQKLTYGIASSERIMSSIVTDGNGDIYGTVITGSGYVVKFDGTDGAKLWETNLYPYYPSKIIMSENGYLYVGGTNVLIKLDAGNGNILATKTGTGTVKSITEYGDILRATVQASGNASSTHMTFDGDSYSGATATTSNDGFLMEVLKF